MKWCPIDPNFYQQSHNPSMQLSSSYRRFLCNLRQRGGCGGAAAATEAIPVARGSPDQAFTVIVTQS
jgi:glutamate synthase domain-containing protein 1